MRRGFTCDVIHTRLVSEFCSCGHLCASLLHHSSVESVPSASAPHLTAAASSTDQQPSTCLLHAMGSRVYERMWFDLVSELRKWTSGPHASKADVPT